MSGMTQTGRLLKFLKKHRSITNTQMVQALNIYQYNARIKELREEGHIIEPVHEQGGKWRYFYLGHRDDAPVVKTPGMLERILRAMVLK